MVWAVGRPRWLTAVLVVLASLVLTLLPSGPAVACSCQPTDVQEMADLAERRQGVVLVAGRVQGGAEPAPDLAVFGRAVRWTLEVDHVVGGVVGATIGVRSPDDGASCGIEHLEAGGRVGWLLRRTEPGDLSVILCDTVGHGEVTALPGRLPLPSDVVATDGPLAEEHGGAVGGAGSRDDGSPSVLAGAALARVGLTTSVLVVVRRLVVRRGRRTGGVRRPRAG